MSLTDGYKTNILRGDDMWLYEKLINSRFEWLQLCTSIQLINGIVYYRVLGITVYKKQI